MELSRHLLISLRLLPCLIPLLIPTMSYSDPAKNLPNIIFILTDDQRWDSVGFMGQKIGKTPHLDQLAKEGYVFENAFVTSAICTQQQRPHRAPSKHAALRPALSTPPPRRLDRLAEHAVCWSASGSAAVSSPPSGTDGRTEHSRVPWTHRRPRRLLDDSTH